MKRSISVEEKLKFWQEKLKAYQKLYNRLRKQSPGRWWHDEHFDNQMKVLEEMILGTKKHLEEIRKKS